MYDEKRVQENCFDRDGCSSQTGTGLLEYVPRSGRVFDRVDNSDSIHGAAVFVDTPFEDCILL